VRIMQSLHQTEKQTAMRGKVSISEIQNSWTILGEVSGLPRHEYLCGFYSTK
jgi:hypothetical protein